MSALLWLPRKGAERAFYFMFFEAPGPWRRIQARLSYDVLSNALSFGIQRMGQEGLEQVTASSGFLNYGYEDADHAAFEDGLDDNHRLRSYSVRLYHHVLEALEPAGKDLLEVGCGRGGGSAYAMSSMAPRSVTGVDLSPVAISFCKKTHDAPGLTFLAGDAQDLPLAAESVDGVFNVESSHCYPSMDDFLAEVFRVLRPGGRFAWVDARPRSGVAALDAAVRRSGLEEIAAVDITPRVLQALDSTSDVKEDMVRDTVPPPFRPLARYGLAVRGTLMYQAFERGDLVYLSRVLRKPDGGSVSKLV
jgi:ubiquinone/menaquinone biosynthesis C-methylase UbiE